MFHNFPLKKRTPFQYCCKIFPYKARISILNVVLPVFIEGKSRYKYFPSVYQKLMMLKLVSQYRRKFGILGWNSGPVIEFKNLNVYCLTGEKGKATHRKHTQPVKNFHNGPLYVNLSRRICLQ